MYITFFVALALGLVFTPMAKKIAFRLDVIDRPNTAAKVHKEPTAYLGGGAIFVSFIITFLIFSYYYDMHYNNEIIGILVGTVGIVILGLIDDMIAVKPLTKLIFQTIITIISMMLGVRANLFGVKILDWIFTLFWLVGLSNALNLIDIMDGLSSGVALIQSIILAIILIIQNNIMLGLMMLTLAGACLGFLKYNFYPAKIFMGDMGSLFLGYLLSAVSLIVFWKDGLNFKVHIPILILFIPIFETVFISILRIKAGRSPFKPSKDHFAFRMVKRGFTIKGTVLTTYAIVIGFGILSIASYLNDYFIISIIITIIFTITFVKKLTSSVEEVYAKSLNNKKEVNH